MTIVNLIESRIGKTLDEVFRQPEAILNEQAGVVSECSFCDSPGRFCLRHPGHLCGRVYKAGTVLDEYEAALRRVQRHAFGVCMSCGGRIQQGILKRQPDASICSNCRVELSMRKQAL